MIVGTAFSFFHLIYILWKCDAFFFSMILFVDVLKKQNKDKIITNYATKSFEANVSKT